MRRVIAFAVWLAVAMLPGCTSEAAPSFAATHEVTTETDYYKTGPQQSTPPDGKLQAGTKVKKVRDAGSYAVVQTEAGDEVHVAADSLKALEGSK